MIKKLIVVLLLLLPLTAFAGSKYISTTGSDSNTGESSTSAWKTLSYYTTQDSLGNIAVSESLFVCRGDSAIGQLNLFTGGTVSAPKLICVYGRGENPVINGDSTYAYGIVAASVSVHYVNIRCIELFGQTLYGIENKEAVDTWTLENVSGTYNLAALAPPTNVSATDGIYTDEVVVTWTKSSGATDYHVWRDGVDLGAAGDADSLEDTSADASSISVGTVSASDSTDTAKVDVALEGASATEGTIHTYRVVAWTGSESSGDSDPDTGYRGVGELAMQLQRSAGDSDADYSDISGITVSAYADSSTPAPTLALGAASASDSTYTGYVYLTLSGTKTVVGEGRYYRYVLEASGASNSPDTTVANRGCKNKGTLGIQWLKSASDDSTSEYSEIAGATVAAQRDVSAPVDGSWRYFKAALTGSPALADTTNADRGAVRVGSASAGQPFWLRLYQRINSSIFGGGKRK